MTRYPAFSVEQWTELQMIEEQGHRQTNYFDIEGYAILRPRNVILID